MSDSASEEETPVIVIDNGSATIKAGFSGDEEPRTVFPSIVRYPRSLTDFQTEDVKTCYIGNEAHHTSKTSFPTLNHPIEQGVITNWDDMEKIWHYTFQNVLRVDPEEHPVLLTETSFNSRVDREKMTEIMFETFQTPSLCVANQVVCGLYASGRVTGIVIESGDSVTQVVSICDSYSHPYYFILDSTTMAVAGRRLTEKLSETLILNERGSQCSFATRAGESIVQDIKEKMCYVALDSDQEIEASSSTPETDRSYELPDGSNIILGNERFMTPEILFKPSLLGENVPGTGAGIHEIIYDSIMRSNDDVYYKKRLFGNCVLSGGNTMFRGFAERLDKELQSLAPATLKVRVIAPPERKHSVWLGGSITASLTSFPEMCVTKEEYEEAGPAVVHTKCY